MGDRLRGYWDFDDLDLSEQRFRELLASERNDEGRAEALTQLARVEGLRGRFDEGNRLLDEADALAGPSSIVRARIGLERGRLLRSSGNPEAALPLFEAAFETATAIPHEFLAADPVHMAAIAAPDFDVRLAWAERGIELAAGSKDDAVTYWLGSLYNNLGRDYFDQGDYETSLEWFACALAERERRPDEPERIAHARDAVDEAQRMLRRRSDA